MSSAYRVGTAAADMVTVLVETPEHQKSVQRGQRLAYGVNKQTCYQHGAVWREWKGWFWTAQTTEDAFPSLSLPELKALYAQGRIWWADRTAAGSGSYSEGKPLDVVMVLDRSGSMRDAMDKLKEAANIFIDTMNPLHDQVAILSFSDTVHVDQPLTGDYTLAKHAVNALETGGYTHTGDALSIARDHLLAEGREGAASVVLLFADGVTTGGVDPDVPAAMLKAGGARVIALGLGGADGPELIEIASPGDYYYTPTELDLAKLYRDVAESLGNAVPVEVYWAGNFTVKWEQPLTESAWVSFHLIEVAGYVPLAQ